MGVSTPSGFDGIWTGGKPEGGPAGGGFYRSRCRFCRAPLVSYCDSYDDSGHRIASDSGEAPLPVWSLRGVPWQTIGLATLAIALMLWYVFRGWGRP